MTNLGMIIPSFEKQCGIADYTNKLVDALGKTINVSVLGDGVFDYLHFISNEKLNVVHIQLEYQFFSPNRLKILLQGIRRLGVKSAVTMHTVNENAKGHNIALRYADLILVHSEIAWKAVDALIGRECKIVPMGCDDIVRSGVATRADLGVSDERIVSTFGMGYFHKGLKELILLADKVKAVFLIVSSKPAQEPHQGYFQQCRVLAEQFKNIIWVDQFLPIDKVVDLLALSDLIVLPYREYGGIATSASVRTAMCADVPIMTSDTCFFNDVVSEVMQYHGNLDGEILGNAFAIANKNKRAFVDRITQFRNEHSWQKVAEKHKLIYEELLKGGVK